MDGLLVVGLVIIGLHRHALAPEGMVLGYQLFRDRRVLDARPDLVGDEFGEKIVGLLVEQQIAESAQPAAIARLVVARFDPGVALLNSEARRGVKACVRTSKFWRSAY